ncbi:MAG: recombination protein RecR [Bacteroides sp. SM23_62_1]|nr:MAG: recombination protein RecR [Bacteroides sp. SM23_62_1]
MSLQHYPSKLLEQAVKEFAKLPGIGNKTALRLVLYLLKQDAADVEVFGQAIIQLRNNIKHCQTCRNISDTDVCQICSSPSRDHQIICVVENIRDVMSIENTNQYSGVYHVLGGIISPMDGIGPGDLFIDSLERRVAKGNINEIILALSTTMEGDTTNFYIYRRLNKYPVKITTLARGVAVGDELEYADEITLGRSIINRTLFVSSLAENKQDKGE